MIYEVQEADLKIMDAAFEKIKNYDPVGANDFTLGLLSVLLIAVSREYEQLKAGHEKYTGLAAWACRNLLELDIFTKWVLQSPANAKRFVADVAIDGTELFEFDERVAVVSRAQREDAGTERNPSTRVRAQKVRRNDPRETLGAEEPCEGGGYDCRLQAHDETVL